MDQLSRDLITDIDADDLFRLLGIGDQSTENSTPDTNLTDEELTPFSERTPRTVNSNNTTPSPIPRELNSNAGTPAEMIRGNSNARTPADDMDFAEMIRGIGGDAVSPRPEAGRPFSPVNMDWFTEIIERGDAVPPPPAAAVRSAGRRSPRPAIPPRAAVRSPVPATGRPAIPPPIPPPVLAVRSPVPAAGRSPRRERRIINKHPEQVYTSIKELLRGEYETNEEIDSLIENFNNININTRKSPSKNYKLGYQKRLNNKIYVGDDLNKQQIYDDTKQEVGEIYLFINNTVNCKIDDLVGEFNTKKKDYLSKILNDYKDNRGDCQNNFDLDDNFMNVITKFQEDVKGKYIYNDQILRSYSFKNNNSKASDARKGTLKLNETSTRLVQRENNIFNNMKLFIMDNGDDQDMKQWYEDPKVKKFIQRKHLKSYDTLKKEWHDWKRRNNDFSRNFSTRNHRLYVPQRDDIFDREYVNFDEFLKSENGIDKLKEIYRTDLTNFLLFNQLDDKKVNNSVDYLVSRYHLQRMDRKQENGYIVIFDDRRDYLKIPALQQQQQGEIRRRCANGFRLSKRMNEQQQPVKECIENISKKIGLIKFSKSPRRKSPK